MRELALFAGAGGGILAGELLGDTTVCAVERDRAAASVLVRRQNDGHIQPFPIWDDVRTFDGRAWRGAADVVSGGFPCQDISIAGSGDGLDGERSGLWREMARVVREVEPFFVRVENSPMLIARGLGKVLGDLAALGFAARWDVLSAADCGAHHLRERIWIVAAHPDRLRELQRQGRDQEGGRWSGYGAGEETADAACQRCGEWRTERSTRQRHDEPYRCGCASSDADGAGLPIGEALEERLREASGRAQSTHVAGNTGPPSGWPGWPAEPGLVRMVHGVPNRVDRIRALGNAQVPRVAATAWEVLMTPNVRVEPRAR